MLSIATPLPSWLFFILTTGICAFIIIMGAFITKKYVSGLVIDNIDLNVANIIMRQISTLLSVLMAFAVIAIWQDYETQRKNTASEAVIMANIYRDSRGFEPQFEQKIQYLLVKYTQAIISDSWPKMQEGTESEITWRAFNDLYSYAIRLTPGSIREEIVYSNTVKNLNELAKFRRLRHIRNNSPYIPDILWATIYISTVFILFSGFLLRMQKKRTQLLLTSISAVIFGMIFSLLLLMNHPYSGSLQISPEPIEKLLEDVYPSTHLTQ